VVVLGDEARNDHLVGKAVIHPELLVARSYLQVLQITRGEDTVAGHRHRLGGRAVRVERDDLPGRIDRDGREFLPRRSADVLKRTGLCNEQRSQQSHGRHHGGGFHGGGFHGGGFRGCLK